MSKVEIVPRDFESTRILRAIALVVREMSPLTAQLLNVAKGGTTDFQRSNVREQTLGAPTQDVLLDLDERCNDQGGNGNSKSSSPKNTRNRSRTTHGLIRRRRELERTRFFRGIASCVTVLAAGLRADLPPRDSSF